MSADQKMLESLAVFDTNGQVLDPMPGAGAGPCEGQTLDGHQQQHQQQQHQQPALSTVSAINGPVVVTSVGVSAIDPVNFITPMMDPTSQLTGGQPPPVGVSEQQPAAAEPLPQLGLEPALQEALLNAIPPPSNNNVRPTPTSTLPGEFPMSLPPLKSEEEVVIGGEMTAPSIDKIEATISINIPIPEKNLDGDSVGAGRESRPQLEHRVSIEGQDGHQIVDGHQLVMEQERHPLVMENRLVDNLDNQLVPMSNPMAVLDPQPVVVDQPQPPTAVAVTDGIPLPTNVQTTSHQHQVVATPEHMHQHQQQQQHSQLDHLNQQAIHPTNLNHDHALQLIPIQSQVLGPVPVSGAVQVPVPVAIPVTDSTGQDTVNIQPPVVATSLQQVVPVDPPLNGQPEVLVSGPSTPTLTPTMTLTSSSAVIHQTMAPGHSAESLVNLVNVPVIDSNGQLKNEMTEMAAAPEPVAVEGNEMGLKIADDNNNPIVPDVDPTANPITNQVLTSAGFPVCVIATTQSTAGQSHHVGPAVHNRLAFTLPPKKAKLDLRAVLMSHQRQQQEQQQQSDGQSTHRQRQTSGGSDNNSNSQQIPSTVGINNFDLPAVVNNANSNNNHSSDNDNNNLAAFRQASGQRIQTGLPVPFTSVSPIIFSSPLAFMGVAPAVSTIAGVGHPPLVDRPTPPPIVSAMLADGPISLVKTDKLRPTMAHSPPISINHHHQQQHHQTHPPVNHPEYPAISGLLSFIKPEPGTYHHHHQHHHHHHQHSKSGHGQATASSMDVRPVAVDVPLSLSLKSGPPPLITTSGINSTHLGASHLPSVGGLLPTSALNHHHRLVNSHNHSQTSITGNHPTSEAPTSGVPVSVVTSLSGEPTVGKLAKLKPNLVRTKLSITSGMSGTSLTVGSKTVLPAPLLSGDPAKPFQCGLCGKHLASKNVYQLHLRSHSGEKPFTCQLCGHSFSQKTSLTRHMRSHTGERPFPCQICGKRFADKERIKIHMRTHTGEKPFACDVCGKQFSQKSTVKRHMSVHTGEKPFKCPSCGKGFANRGNLTAHAKTHAGS